MRPISLSYISIMYINTVKICCRNRSRFLALEFICKISYFTCLSLPDTLPRVASGPLEEYFT